jgi:hypothetical protein
MILITVLNKLLPRKFAPTQSQKTRVIHGHPDGCFKPEGHGAFLSSHDGRVIPLRKAWFLKKKTKHTDVH